MKKLFTFSLFSMECSNLWTFQKSSSCEHRRYVDATYTLTYIYVIYIMDWMAFVWLSFSWFKTFNQSLNWSSNILLSHITLNIPFSLFSIYILSSLYPWIIEWLKVFNSIETKRWNKRNVWDASRKRRYFFWHILYVDSHFFFFWVEENRYFSMFSSFHFPFHILYINYIHYMLYMLYI